MISRRSFFATVVSLLMPGDSETKALRCLPWTHYVADSSLVSGPEIIDVAHESWIIEVTDQMKVPRPR